MDKAAYESIPPVLQDDPTSCWAAALEWWAKATGRPAARQTDLIGRYERYWDSRGDLATNPFYGTVTLDGMVQIMSDPVWRMNVETVPQSSLNRHYLEPRLPCVLGYLDDTVEMHHAVVVYAVDDQNLYYMDPDSGFRVQPIRRMFLYPRSDVCVGYPG